MRRFFSILFVLLFGLSPLSATLADDNASLPACCRRRGSHHCTMDDAAVARILAASGVPAFTAPSHCPQYPERGNAVPSHTPALPQIARSISFEAQLLPSPAAASVPIGTIYLRIPAPRGPPSHALSS